MSHEIELTKQLMSIANLLEETIKRLLEMEQRIVQLEFDNEVAIATRMLKGE